MNLLLLTLLVRVGSSETGINALEQKALEAFITALETRQPASPDIINELADLDYPAFRKLVNEYVAVEDPDRSTHLRYQSLLERTSRSALAPWKMVKLYSPEFAGFLTQSQNEAASKLFRRLLNSELEHQPFRLAVRLTPSVALAALGRNEPRDAAALLSAWNSRLHSGRESRPIANLNDHLLAITKTWNLEDSPTLIEKRLLFFAGWPQLTEFYARALAQCLDHANRQLVMAGLRVQSRYPCLIDGNEKIIRRFGNDSEIPVSALHNFALDTKQDHSSVLRKTWTALTDRKAQRACLFSMGIHPDGNADIALEAVRKWPYEVFDVAAAVLAKGDRKHARRAVEHMLKHSDRGHEEALRLAATMKLRGSEEFAISIAESEGDLILRQTAMHYLKQAEGKFRKCGLPWLGHSDSDLRLSAIQMMGDPHGLTKGDMNEIGPVLIKVAQSDPSMGHRQEAVFALGKWKAPLAKPFFKKLIDENAAGALQFRISHYWNYRLYLMGLLGMARMEEEGSSARKLLLDIHRRGGPTARMDVLLAFTELGEVPAIALESLAASEPKIVATAARLIRVHGSDDQQRRMMTFFKRSPLWELFRSSGIDDHNILKFSEVAE